MGITKFWKKIWNDPVFSKVIANAIWFLPPVVIGLITRTLKIDLFEKRFSLIAIIIILVFFLIAISLYVQIQSHRKYPSN
jgi:hypothetical protein